jgi:ceramide glucosyltransferase
LWGLLSGHEMMGVVWFAALVLNRWLQAAAILLVMGEKAWFRGTLLYPLRDLIGSVLWLGSYGGDKFYYRGKIYTLKDGGRVEEPQ